MVKDVNNGYSGYNMSKNAVIAYENGEKPISKWTKASIIYEIQKIDIAKAKEFNKLPCKVLKDKCLSISSWHHTSSYFNKTNFYTLNVDYIKEIDIESIHNLDSSTPEIKKSNSYKGNITYIEWAGTKKHPKANKVELQDVIILEKGCFYNIFDKNGKFLIKKKIGSNGTKVTNLDAIAEREKRVKELSSKEAVDFFEQIKNNCQYSNSGHIYPSGRKPCRADYENGLENFFKIGEKRLHEAFTGKLTLEIWDGIKWINN